MLRRAALFGLSLSLAVGLSACGGGDDDDDDDVTEEDGGADAPDAGRDAGSLPDGGSDPDGGRDGGAVSDSGVDGGELPDAGVDAGEMLDGGIDGGEVPDGGVDGGELDAGPDGDVVVDGGSVDAGVVDGGVDDVAALAATMRTCGFLSTGDVNLNLYGDHGRCFARCVNGLTCDEIEDGLCFDGFDTCWTSCGMTCGDGSTIPGNWICDAVDDCSDGSDEAGCGTDDGVYTCSDGSTYPVWFNCDGWDDCSDGGDETGCFTCDSGGDVYGAHELCNLTPWCFDGSDEPSTCAENLLTCDGGGDDDDDPPPPPTSRLRTRRVRPPLR